MAAEATAAEREAITVFAGSNMGASPAFATAAKELGEAIAKQGWTLVYGGGKKGLMGLAAQSAHDAGGYVKGIIPRAFVSNAAESEYVVVPSDRREELLVGSMHERKQLMARLAGKDGFIALPGGYGTLEEVAEMTTWTQLGIHRSPVVLLNVEGCFDPLRDFVDNAIKAGFIPSANRQFLVFVDDEPGANWGERAITAAKEWKGGEEGEPFKLDWS